MRKARIWRAFLIKKRKSTRTVEFFGSNKANVFPFVIFNSPEVAKNQTLGVKQLTRECTHKV